MTTTHILPQPTVASLSFEIPFPEEAAFDGFDILRGTKRPSDSRAAQINEIAASHGVLFLQFEENGAYRHCFAVPRAVADANPFVDDDLRNELADADLIAFDCVAD